MLVERASLLVVAVITDVDWGDTSIQSLQAIIVWDYGAEGLNDHSEKVFIWAWKSKRFQDLKRVTCVLHEAWSPNQGRQRCWRLGSYKLKRLAGRPGLPTSWILGSMQTFEFLGYSTVRCLAWWGNSQVLMAWPIALATSSCCTWVAPWSNWW